MDYLLNLFMAFLFIAVLIGGVSSCNYVVEKKNCQAYAEVTGRPTQYRMWTCYGQLDGVWYDQGEFNNRFNPQRKEYGVDIK